MTLDEKVERSKSSERIDFSKIQCLQQADPLVPVAESDKLAVKPVWTLPDDFEGRLYAEFIAEHPRYDHVWVRSGLLEQLEKAVALLPDNWQLVLRAGHRPLEVQRRLLHDCMQDYKAAHPEASDKAALEHTRIFVSDPDIKLPPHCCGAAIDVEVFDITAQQMADFGGKLNEDSDISYLHNPKVSAAQAANRQQLLTTMLQAGFASYYAEWWHFSYGDEIWAWFYHEPACLYGIARDYPT